MPRCPQPTLPAGGCTSCGTTLIPPFTDICLACDTLNNFILHSSSEYCICMSGYFYDGITCSSCTTNDPACSTCAGPTLCLSCVANFTLVSGKC